MVFGRLSPYFVQYSVDTGHRVDIQIFNCSNQMSNSCKIALNLPHKESFNISNLVHRSKLMRLDRGRLEIQSKSYWNRLLIDFFDPNYVRTCIEIVATIRNLGLNSNLTSNLYRKWSNLSQIVNFGRRFRYKSTVSIK